MKTENWEIVELIKAFYNEPNNGAGGHLHLVTDDGNLEDDDIRFCIEQAGDNNDLLAMSIGYLLLSLPYKERERIWNELWVF
jgi:hypothetical protein